MICSPTFYNTSTVVCADLFGRGTREWTEQTSRLQRYGLAANMLGSAVGSYLLTLDYDAAKRQVLRWKRWLYRFWRKKIAPLIGGRKKQAAVADDKTGAPKRSSTEEGVEDTGGAAAARNRANSECSSKYDEDEDVTFFGSEHPERNFIVCGVLHTLPLKTRLDTRRALCKTTTIWSIGCFDLSPACSCGSTFRKRWVGRN